jgi:anthranilate phosphoribosyltransferase
MKEGVRLAAQAIDSGAARDKLDVFVQLTGSLA